MRLKLINGSGFAAGYHDALVRREIELENERRNEAAEIVLVYEVRKPSVGAQYASDILTECASYADADSFIEDMKSAGLETSGIFISRSLVPRWK